MAAAAGAAATAGLVAAVPPRGQLFYPACPFHRITGLWCPLCGSTRAVHAVLSGHVGAALHDNALLFLAAPLIGYVWLGWLLERTGRRRLPAPVWNRAMTVVVLLVVFAYGVVRNLPIHPFNGLAPLATVRK